MYLLVKSLTSFGDLRQTINRNKFRLTSEDCANHLHILIKCPGDMQIINHSKKTTLDPPLACYTRPLLRLDLKTPQNNLPNFIL